MGSTRFPTTPLPVRLWPGTALDEPCVWRSVPLMEDDWDGWIAWVAPGDRSKGLPMELVIRELLDLDLSDAYAVVEFLRFHGVISIPHPNVVLGVPPNLKYGDFLRQRDEHAARDREIRAEAAERFGFGRRPAVHLQDVRQYLFDAQRLAKTWIAFMDDDHVWPIWMSDDGVQRSGKAAASWAAKCNTDAWAEFVHTLNEGLKHFAARAELTWEDHTIGEPRAGLYSALCVQLYNLMVAGHEEVRTCANETCRHRFIHQRGGAVYGQYRSSGVIYCTNRCAKTQGQRELRRRKKEQPK